MIKVFDKSEIYYIIDKGNNKVERTLYGLNNLIIFLAYSQDADKRWGTDGFGNPYLDHFNATGKDIETNSYWLYGVKMNKVTEVYLRQYTVVDGLGRTIDVRDYAKEILEVAKKYNPKSRYYSYSDRYLDRVKRHVGEGYRGPIYRQEPIPYTGKYRWGYEGYRKVGTINELRQNSDPEIKEYIRAARNKRNLPTAWDDLPRCTEKCWKSQSKKRKQWM